jgi:hypothetical protein
MENSNNRSIKPSWILSYFYNCYSFLRKQYHYWKSGVCCQRGTNCAFRSTVPFSNASIFSAIFVYVRSKILYKICL